MIEIVDRPMAEDEQELLDEFNDYFDLIHRFVESRKRR